VLLAQVLLIRLPVNLGSLVVSTPSSLSASEHTVEFRSVSSYSQVSDVTLPSLIGARSFGRVYFLLRVELEKNGFSLKCYISSATAAITVEAAGRTKISSYGLGSLMSCLSSMPVR